MKSKVHACLAGFCLAILGLPALEEAECDLSETAICSKLPPHEAVSCIKHVQIAVGACRKAARTERFGSHEDHCRVACDAGLRLFDLDRRMRKDAQAIVKQTGAGQDKWLMETLRFWEAQSAGSCSDEQFAEAQEACLRHCETKAVRRDLKELQGLAKGEDFLALERPVYACRPSSTLELLSRDRRSGLDKLYPPGHARLGE